MRMTSRKSDWLILIGGALLLLVTVLLISSKTIDSQVGQTVVLAMSAVILLWYTIETMRLRRDAEDRADRDRQARIQVEIRQFPYDSNAPYLQYRFYFFFKNQSSNSALARVRVRLRTNSGTTVLSPNNDYAGRKTWEVGPFWGIRGWFDLKELLNAARELENASSDPLGEMRLNFEVDVYRPDLKYLFKIKSEYYVCVTPPNDVKFWPEVATSLPELPPTPLS